MLQGDFVPGTLTASCDDLVPWPPGASFWTQLDPEPKNQKSAPLSIITAEIYRVTIFMTVPITHAGLPIAVFVICDPMTLTIDLLT